MRIVGGRFKGRGLTGPASSYGASSIRPTSDRLREALFNILAHGFQESVIGARVIDLFAGTGALGLEALSRGAAFVLFVDEGAEARALIRANVDHLKVGGETRIFRRDATRLGQAPAGERFGLAFLDPPYGHGLAPPALAQLRDGGWLAADALCLVEEAADAAIELPAGFTYLEIRSYGDTQVSFLRFAGLQD